MASKVVFVFPIQLSVFLCNDAVCYLLCKVKGVTEGRLFDKYRITKGA